MKNYIWSGLVSCFDIISAYLFVTIIIIIYYYYIFLTIDCIRLKEPWQGKYYHYQTKRNVFAAGYKLSISIFFYYLTYLPTARAILPSAIQNYHACFILLHLKKNVTSFLIHELQLLRQRMKFCDENSSKQKAPYICLARKLPPTECDKPIRVSGIPPFCQDDCPASLQEDMEADLFFCRKLSRWPIQPQTDAARRCERVSDE